MKSSFTLARGHVGRRARALLASSVGAVVLASALGSAQQPTSQRPNFLVIVADDLGFSDLGSYGGEIHTPNLDRLAREGMRYTDFYVGPSCSPTRSMLMTGMDHHRVGLGNMHERTAPSQVGQPGYEGVLSTDVPTLPERLRDAGYHTYMAGKWHLGHAPTHIPAARGFERSFALLNGAGSHFTLTGKNSDNERSEFVEDGNYLTRLPKGYYSTRTLTERLVDFIDSNEGDGQPFFAWLAFQAPHDPLQVPDDWLRRYQGRYDEGWDVIRECRVERMRDLGLVPKGAQAAPRLWYVPEWTNLGGVAQSTTARRMEIYAAMVEYLDREVGRMLDHLKEKGLLDNTVVLFFSDNGPEGADSVATAQARPNAYESNWLARNYDTTFPAWGRRDGFVAYGAAWAQVSATPFWGLKGTTFEGGVRSPLIVWRPGEPTPGAVNRDAVLHVMDIAPTLLDLAGVDPKAAVRGRTSQPMQGVSWASMLRGDVRSPRSAQDGIGMELSNGKAFRRGPWKIVNVPEPFGTGHWQLFNVVDDPAERRERSADQPALKAELVAAWESYARLNGVVPADRSDYDGLTELLPPRPPVDGNWPPGQEPNWTGDGSDPQELFGARRGACK